MERSTAMAGSFGRTEARSKATLLTTRWTDMVCMSGSTGDDMKGSGITISSMDKACSPGATGVSTEVATRMTNVRATAS